MRIRALCIFVLLVLGPYALASPEDAGAPLKKKELSALSHKADGIIKAMLDNEASEYKRARVYKRLPIKGFSEVFVVLFTIEGFSGGNNYQFYMALFGQSHDRFNFIDVIKIGSAGWRHVDFSSVTANGNGIELDTLEYQGEDANCCPSIKSKAHFVFLTDCERLIEVNNAHNDAK